MLTRFSRHSELGRFFPLLDDALFVLAEPRLADPDVSFVTWEFRLLLPVANRNRKSKKLRKHKPLNHRGSCTWWGGIYLNPLLDTKSDKPPEWLRLWPLTMWPGFDLWHQHESVTRSDMWFFSVSVSSMTQWMPWSVSLPIWKIVDELPSLVFQSLYHH